MKLKTDDEGKPVYQDGLPVFVTDGGEEKPTDLDKIEAAMSKANDEAVKFRKRAKDAEAKVKLFGDLDPEAAKAAVAFKTAMGDKIDPEKVEHQLAELQSQNAGLKTQVEERDAKISTLEGSVDGLSYDVQIRGSEFVSKKVAAALRDPERFRSAFGKNLDRDDAGNVIVKDAAGNTIMSEKNPGQPAPLDEALPKIVTSPNDLAAGNASGGGGGGGGGGKPPTSLKKLGELPLAEQAKAIRANAEKGGDLKNLGFPG